VFVALRVRCILYHTLPYSTGLQCPASIRSFVVAMARSRVACSLPAAKHCTVPYRTRCQTQTQRPTHQRNATQGPPSTACDAMRCQKNIGTIHCCSFLYPGASISDSVVSNGMAWYLLRVESSRVISVGCHPNRILRVVAAIRSGPSSRCAYTTSSGAAPLPPISSFLASTASYRIALHPSPYGMCCVFQLRRWSSFFWRSSFHL